MVSSSSLDRSKTRDATSIEVRMERDVNALPSTVFDTGQRRADEGRSEEGKEGSSTCPALNEVFRGLALLNPQLAVHHRIRNTSYSSKKHRDARAARKVAW